MGDRLFLQSLAWLGGGEVHAAEALARWHHLRLGIVIPDRFVSTLERTDPTAEFLPLRAPGGRPADHQVRKNRPAAEIEAAPGNPDLVSNVKIDGVVIASVMRLSGDSFVATAYPTDPDGGYTIGGGESAEEGAEAVVAEWLVVRAS